MSRGGFVNFDFRMFFDRKPVIDAVERANKRNLSKAGAFVRTAARSSIRRRKTVSVPGTPPSAHSTDRVATIKNILFAYEPSNQGVVVGPVLLNGSRGSPTVPELLEFGGTVMRESRSRRGGGRKALRYRSRPFMKPALKKEAPKFPDLWADSVR